MASEHGMLPSRDARRSTHDVQHDLKRKMREAPPIVGSMIYECTTVGLPAILAAAGLDFVVFDLEASALALETLRALVIASDAAGVAPLARVPNATSETIGRILETGVSGLIAPKVETPAVARAFVDLAKYPPLGARGVADSVARRSHGPNGMRDAMEAANSELVLVCQVETMLGLENVEGIAAVQGVDVVLPGLNDLAADMGLPGDLENEAILAALARIEAAATGCGKAFGGGASAKTNTSTPATFVLLSSDRKALYDALRREMGTLVGGEKQ